MEYINTELLSRRGHEARILRVKSPLLFWVRLKTGEATLNELLTDLMIYMCRRGQQFSLWPHEITEEALVAVRDRDEWQRGEIIRTNQARRRALIALGDWGRTVWKPYRELYHLEERFRKLPWQAIACGLAHTGPSIPSYRWPQKTRALCRILAEEEDGRVRFQYPLWPGAALVDITILGSRNEEMVHKTIHLRTALVELGHARVEKRVTVDTFPAI
jgi:hypothetical protein